MKYTTVLRRPGGEGQEHDGVRRLGDLLPAPEPRLLAHGRGDERAGRRTCQIVDEAELWNGAARVEALRRVVAACRPDNEPSWRVMEHCGMTYVEPIQRWSIARRETFNLSLYAIERPPQVHNTVT